MEKGASLRYQIRENQRIKRERNQYKMAWRDSKKELEELKRRNKTLSVGDKTSLVFLTLQLFVVARIGFRAISRVLALMAPRLGLAKTDQRIRCPTTCLRRTAGPKGEMAGRLNHANI